MLVFQPQTLIRAAPSNLLRLSRKNSSVICSVIFIDYSSIQLIMIMLFEECRAGQKMARSGGGYFLIMSSEFKLIRAERDMAMGK